MLCLILCDTLHKTEHPILKTFNSQARIKWINCLINRTPISPYIYQHYYAFFISLWSNFMSMDPWVSYRAGTWLIDECQIAFFMSCLMLRNLEQSFLSLFSFSVVFPTTICLGPWNFSRYVCLWMQNILYSPRLLSLLMISCDSCSDQ